MTPLDSQIQLKHHLQSMSSAKFEYLAAALLGRLLDVPIAIAKSGFQHGADAGPAGRQGRRFRLECKKYTENSSLSERELLGEIDQAIARDRAIEAWILVATCPVSEQLHQSLEQHGQRTGVPVLIIDWTDDDVAPISALFSFDPDLIEAKLSKDASVVARILHPASQKAIARLRRDLQSWSIGFETVRNCSHARLTTIWNSPREANATFGQNAAGGAQRKKIRRNKVHDALTAWWRESPIDSPAAVVGFDGVGKTWATLDWLIDNKDQLPIVLTVPSSAADATRRESETSVKELLADILYETTGVRDPQHWLLRLNRLLARPIDEGCVLTLFFDGLNQNTSVAWVKRLKVMQGERFFERVRVIVSTRIHFFGDKLSSLHSLFVPATRISVDPYDTSPGGEFDRMLTLEGISRADLHPGVIELARTPRLFSLVVRFRERLTDAGQATVHRLLWEYGRDTLRTCHERAFGEDEWHDWLKQIATKCRDGVQAFSLKSLGETVCRPDLTTSEVYARLSDIIDGRLATRNESGDLQLNPVVVAHALAAGLLAYLDQVGSPTFANIEETLATWLDPIAGLDQRSEVLRASLSILVGQGKAHSSVSGVLVTSWLQSQSVPEERLRELVALAPSLPEALLDAVEHLDTHVQSLARRSAIHALQTIPRTDSAALAAIVERSCRWLRVVSRGVDPRSNANDQHEERRSSRFIQRVGRDSSGPIRVAGVDIVIVDESGGVLPATVPSIIEGFPLINALPIFEIAAVTLAVADANSAWAGLKWICLLNRIDYRETRIALSALAEDFRRRTPEHGLHQHLPLRVAALLLWLTGHDQDDESATSINPDLYRACTYQNDYLPKPDTSLFPLERRHATRTLNNADLRPFYRVQRVGDLWFDPQFVPTEHFVPELRDAVAQIDITKLHRRPARTIEYYQFEKIAPSIARCAPNVLASLIRKKLQSMDHCPDESRYWNAIHATDDLILARDPETIAARKLRVSSKEMFASENLLLLEISRLDVHQQIHTVLQADLDFISIAYESVLKSPTRSDISTFVDRYADSSSIRQHNLLLLLSLMTTDLDNRSWTWIRTMADTTASRAATFNILARTDPKRFGQDLRSARWSWSRNHDPWVNHYGTNAIVEATLDTPFCDVASTLAPWRLLQAARRRGSDPTDTRLAASLFGDTLLSPAVDVPDPGSDLLVELCERESIPFAYSISPRPEKSKSGIPRLPFDSGATVLKYQSALDIAVKCIRDTWQSGASLYLATFDPKDFESLFDHALEDVEQWLDGYSGPTDKFKRQVLMAEGAYLALCEALLTHDPTRGIKLWKILRSTVTTRFVGHAGVDEFLHIVFRAPDSTEVAALRSELLDLEHCNTDRALFDVALAASYNGKSEWLTDVIRVDKASTVPWKRKRAEVLAGFTVNNTLPVPGAWPQSEIRTDAAMLACTSARSRWSEACARHWWSVFLDTTDPELAYAAWVLFLDSADRRAQVWTARETIPMSGSAELVRLKVAHNKLNRSNLKRALKKRDDKLEKTFLGRSTVAGIGPWNNPVTYTISSVQ